MWGVSAWVHAFLSNVFFVRLEKQFVGQAFHVVYGDEEETEDVSIVNVLARKARSSPKEVGSP